MARLTSNLKNVWVPLFVVMSALLFPGCAEGIRGFNHSGVNEAQIEVTPLPGDLADGELTSQASNDEGGKGASDNSGADMNSPETKSEPNDQYPSENPSEKADRSECARALGLPEESIRVAGNQSQSQVSAGAVLLVRVTGNMSSLTLKIGSESQMPISGLCIFASGNRSRVRVEVGTSVGAVSYRARGNQSSGVIEVGAQGKIGSFSQVNLGGNQSSLKVMGPGEFTCPVLTSSGNQPILDCAK